MKFKYTQSVAAAMVAMSALLAPAAARADSDTLLTSGTFSGTTGSLVFSIPTTSSAIISLLGFDPVFTGVSFQDLSLPGAPTVALSSVDFLNTFGGNAANGADVVSIGINKLIADHDYQMSWTATAGTDYEIHASFAAPIGSSAVPEPESVSLILAGLAVAGVAFRRRQVAQA
jgi:hypothetical protein